MLNQTLTSLKVAKTTTVVSGVANLAGLQSLQNQGRFKKLMREFMGGSCPEPTTGEGAGGSGMNDLAYDKRDFVPWVDERDQLGRLI
jgi:hypothetical protein